MKLADVMVAKVLGGVFHVEDALFQTSIESYVKQLTAVVRKARKAKIIKHDYFVRLLGDDAETKTKSAKLSLQCVDENKVQVQLSEKAVVLEIGTLLTQNSLFHRDGYLRDAARLIDEIVKLRRPKKVVEVGVFPKFAIPYKSAVAPDHLRNLMFKSFDKAIGLPNVDELDGLSFVAITHHKKIVVESRIKTSDDGEAILAFFDIRTHDPVLVKSYDRFLLKAKPLYESICNRIIQRFISLSGIKQRLLTGNE